MTRPAPDDQGEREIRRLIERGLAHYGRDELAQAQTAWEDALTLDPDNEQARHLLQFVRARLVVGGQTFSDDWETPEVTDPESPKETAARLRRAEEEAARAHRAMARRQTIESPIPQFLAPMTAPAFAEPGRQEGAPEKAILDESTRRVGSDAVSVSGGKVPATAEARTADSASGARVRAADLVDLCRVELERGNLGEAAQAAEHALREADSAPAPGITEVIEPARPLFEQVFATYLGPTPRKIPISSGIADRLPANEMDPRAAFLLSRIDGTLTVEQVLEVAGMSRFEALRVLAKLVKLGAVKLV